MHATKKSRFRLRLFLPLLLLTGVPAATCAQSQADAAVRPVAGVHAPGQVLPLAAYYQENPVVEVARSTLYGGLAGLALGLAAALVVNDGGEAVKWGFVLGTFGGFIWGVVHYTKSSDQQALLQIGRTEGAHLRLPSPQAFRLPDGRPGVRLPLLKMTFGPERIPRP